MEFRKIVNFLDTTFDNKDLPKLVTKKWVEVYDQPQGSYNVNKEIRIKTSMLRNYYRDQPSNPLSTDSESFKYKTNITGNTYNVNDDNDNYDANKAGKNETEIVIPTKYESNFWRSLNIPLINCEVELILTWSKNCVLADMTR